MEEINEQKTSEQVRVTPNPTGKGGFREHPENRSNGTWDATQSISHNYNKLLRMSYKEIEKWLVDNPEENRTPAQQLAYEAVILKAKNDLKYLTEITDRTEGKSPQKIDMNANLEHNLSFGEALRLIRNDGRTIKES